MCYTSNFDACSYQSTFLSSPPQLPSYPAIRCPTWRMARGSRYTCSACVARTHPAANNITSGMMAGAVAGTSRISSRQK